MTRRIQVGAVPVGGGAAVSIQSMCNTPTEDVNATVRQIQRLEQAGCEIVRVAVPTEEAARAIPSIKAAIHIPLVADIHFDYRLALLCVDGGVDKIRINPGNIGSAEKVRAVADAGLGKGTVQADVCAHHLFAEQRSAHVADARRACCMRTGRTDHHRPHHIENIDHGNPVLSGFLRKKHIISAAEKRVKFPRPRCDY